MSAAINQVNQQLPGNPTQLTPAEQQRRQELVAAIATAVGVAVAQKMIADKQTQVLHGLGFSAEFMRNALTKFYVGIAGVSFLLMLEMAKIESNDSTPNPPDPNFINEVVNLEVPFEVAWAKNGSTRIIDNMRFAAENEMSRAIKEGKDPNNLDDAAKARLRDSIHALVSRESEYSKMRLSAMKQRTERRSNELGVRANSPLGAFWLIDPTKKKHTADCLAMAGKTWSWDVLKIIRPSNRHYGCGCQLITMDMARAAGYPNVDQVHTTVPSGVVAATRRDA